MSVEVRPCADRADFNGAFMQIGQYFGMDPDGSDSSVRFERLLPIERMLAAWEGDEIVGGAGTLPFRLSVPGGSVACAGTTVVGVAPTHRRRGILGAMMRSHLEDAHERGEAVAALWASEEGIYGRFGYGRASFAGEIALPREHVAFGAPVEVRGRPRLVEREEAVEVFPPVYDALARRRPGMIHRSSEWWEDRTLADPTAQRYGAGPKRFALLEQDGEAVGYAIYRHQFGYEAGSSSSKLVVVEATAAETDAMAAVWRFLLDVDWTATITCSFVPPDHPLFFLLRQPRWMRYRMGDGLWVRLVDVGAALSARTYAGDGEVVLEVRDELCTWNAGRWRVGGSGSEPTEAEADLALDVGTLGALYLGGVGAAALAQGGWLEERTPGAIDRCEALFRHGLHPWCPEIF